MRKKFGLTIIVLSIVIIITFLFFRQFLSVGQAYETNNIADYGKVMGNIDDNFPQKLIGSYFPEEILPLFQNVVYHYKAINGDHYACEIWLEFTIQEGYLFEEYLTDAVDPELCFPFPYMEGYMEYSLCHQLFLHDEEAIPGAGYSIGQADLRKVIYCPDEHRVIFYALLVHDGGWATTAELSKFFDYFRIDPIDYYKDNLPSSPFDVSSHWIAEDRSLILDKDDGSAIWIDGNEHNVQFVVSSDTFAVVSNVENNNERYLIGSFCYTPDGKLVLNIDRDGLISHLILDAVG